MSRAKRQYKKAKELATIYHENGCGRGEFMAEVYAGALLMYEWCVDIFAPQLEKVRNARTAVIRRNKKLIKKSRQNSIFIRELFSRMRDNCTHKVDSRIIHNACHKLRGECCADECPLLKNTQYQIHLKKLLKKNNGTVYCLTNS